VRTPVPGSVERLIFDRRSPGSGAFVYATGSGWLRASTTGFTQPVSDAMLPPPADRVVPSSLQEIYREFPTVESFERMLTRDDQLRTWPVTAGARSPERSEVWLGTMGNGLFKVDPYFNQGTHLPFGLLDYGAGAPIAVATVQLDYLRRPAVRTCEVIGEDGRITVNLLDGRLVRTTTEGAVAAEECGFDRNDLFMDEVRHFLACVDGTEKPIATLRDGAMSLKLALAAQQSLVMRVPVDLVRDVVRAE